MPDELVMALSRFEEGLWMHDFPQLTVHEK